MRAIEKKLLELERKRNIIQADPTPAESARINLGLLVREYCLLEQSKSGVSDVDTVLDYTNQWREKLGEKKFAKLFLGKQKTKMKNKQNNISGSAVALQIAAQKAEEERRLRRQAKLMAHEG